EVLSMKGNCFFAISEMTVSNSKNSQVLSLLFSVSEFTRNQKGLCREIDCDPVFAESRAGTGQISKCCPLTSAVTHLPCKIQRIKVTSYGSRRVANVGMRISKVAQILAFCLLIANLAGDHKCLIMQFNRALIIASCCQRIPKVSKCSSFTTLIIQ